MKKLRMHFKNASTAKINIALVPFSTNFLKYHDIDFACNVWEKAESQRRLRYLILQWLGVSASTHRHSIFTVLRVCSESKGHLGILQTGPASTLWSSPQHLAFFRWTSAVSQRSFPKERPPFPVADPRSLCTLQSMENVWVMVMCLQV